MSDVDLRFEFRIGFRNMSLNLDVYVILDLGFRFVSDDGLTFKFRIGCWIWVLNLDLHSILNRTSNLWLNVNGSYKTFECVQINTKHT